MFKTLFGRKEQERVLPPSGSDQEDDPLSFNEHGSTIENILGRIVNTRIIILKEDDYPRGNGKQVITISSLERAMIDNPEHVELIGRKFWRDEDAEGTEVRAFVFARRTIYGSREAATELLAFVPDDPLSSARVFYVKNDRVSEGNYRSASFMSEEELQRSIFGQINPATFEGDCMRQITEFAQTLGGFVLPRGEAHVAIGNTQII